MNGLIFSLRSGFWPSRQLGSKKQATINLSINDIVATSLWLSQLLPFSMTWTCTCLIIHTDSHWDGCTHASNGFQAVSLLPSIQLDIKLVMPLSINGGGGGGGGQWGVQFVNSLEPVGCTICRFS